MNMQYRIIVDSACDLKNNYLKETYNEEEIGFAIVPFIIDVDGKEFVDDDTIDTKVLLEHLNKSKRSRSSCPSTLDFEKVMDATFNFVITISSKLSGSYNSANAAKNAQDKHSFIIDSKGTAGMEELLVDKLYQLIKEGKTYEEIKKDIITYRDSLTLYFTLAKYDNLVKTGRINRLLAKIVTLARIKALCKANDGEIAIAKKCLTYNQCLKTIVNHLRESRQKYEKCVITYCIEDKVANELKKQLESLNIFKTIVVRNAKGLDAFYALENSLIVVF